MTYQEVLRSWGRTFKAGCVPHPCSFSVASWWCGILLLYKLPTCPCHPAGSQLWVLCFLLYMCVVSSGGCCLVVEGCLTQMRGGKRIDQRGLRWTKYVGWGQSLSLGPSSVFHWSWRGWGWGPLDSRSAVWIRSLRSHPTKTFLSVSCRISSPPKA